jgi:hypothetical protein
LECLLTKIAMRMDLKIYLRYPSVLPDLSVGKNRGK